MNREVNRIYSGCAFIGKSHLFYQNMEPYASVKNLHELVPYQLSRDLGRLVWNIVRNWDYEKKKMIGFQWTSATDSMSANIAEGYGRYYFNDSVKFYYYSRGSAFESFDWFEKARERNLLSDEEIAAYAALYEKFPVELNVLIKRVKEKARENKKHNSNKIT